MGKSEALFHQLNTSRSTLVLFTHFHGLPYHSQSEIALKNVTDYCNNELYPCNPSLLIGSREFRDGICPYQTAHILAFFSSHYRSKFRKEFLQKIMPDFLS